MNSEHIPVLLEEAIHGLAIQEEGIYVDATFGRGGHSQAILKHLGAKGRLLVVDKDPDAIAYAHELFAHDDRVMMQQSSYAHLFDLTKQLNIAGHVNGVLLDCGLSSPQLADQNRGFSFMKKGPLDMRMDPEQRLSATVWLQEAKQTEIADVLKTYGEERFAKSIASAIVEQRSQKPLETTHELVAIVKKAKPFHEKNKHPATRVFQAIRIFINNELKDLTLCLSTINQVLAVGGRLAVISFHSLEDRIVKRFIRRAAKGQSLPDELPVTQQQLAPSLRSIGKAIKPSEMEIKQNVRARSAVLRIAEKLL